MISEIVPLLSENCMASHAQGNLIQPNISLVLICAVTFHTISLQKNSSIFISRDCCVEWRSKLGYEEQCEIDTKETVHNALVLKWEALGLPSTLYHSWWNHTVAFWHEHLSNGEYVDQRTKAGKTRRNPSTFRRWKRDRI